MTNSFAAMFDELMHAAFTPVGLADTATYWPPDGAGSYPCRVLVDRGVSLQGDLSQVINDQITITCFLADLQCRPSLGGSFEISGETFTIDSISNGDESRVVCIVKVGE